MQKLESSKQPDIAQLGHPVLRRKAQTVNNILSHECQSLIRQMMTTVENAGGVGIAAPQIYQNVRIFIMCSKPNERYPNAPLMAPTAIINPEIIDASPEIEKDWEGCLSVPALRGLVPRHKSIKVSYYDANGEHQNTVFTDFVARIFQHELDHLNGITFIDRVESSLELMSEREWYQQHVKTS